jgi:subtilase family serine protease
VRLSILGFLAAVIGAQVIAGAAQGPPQPPQPPQPPGRRVISKPAVVASAKHDVSPALRDIPPKPPKAEREPLAPQPLRRGRPFIRLPDPVLQTSAPAVAAPGPIFNFDGVNNVDGVLPPDTNGDIGPNHYVQWVNLTFAVYSRSGSLLYGPAAGRTIWSGFGGPCETQNDGDPIVLYDELADRWIMSQFSIPNRFFSLLFAPFYQCIAISQTPDPTGAYYRYQYEFAKLNDYPKFGVWPDAYYMTINQFAALSLEYAGQGVVAFDRAAMLAGQPANMIYFDLASDLTLGGMLPSDLDGPAPPAGSPNYFAQVDDDGAGYPADQIQLWRFHADWAAPASSTFTGPFTLPVAAFDSNMCNYARACIPQAGTTVKVDALADRLMYRLQYRNFGTHDALTVNHTVDVDGSDHAGVRWYEIRNPGSTPVIHQQGTFSPDAHHRWMGSAAMDAAGNLALAFNVSGPAIAPSIRYAARLASDPPGVLGQGENDLIMGTGSQTNTASRWGDYSMLGVDPVDGCTFWMTGEYYAATSSAGWQTRIGAFRLPGCGTAISPPAAPDNLSASAVSSSSIDLQWVDNSTDEGGFQVERCTGTMAACAVSGAFLPAGLTPADATSYADGGLQASTTYSYRVRAFNGGGTSAYSELAQATTAPPPTVTMTVTDATATEAGPTGGTFTISRGVAPPASLTVTYTLTGTATNGTDYLSIATTAVIPAGASSVDVAVTPIDDSSVESNETVVLTLKASPAYVVGTPASGTITIVSDDVAPDLVVSALTAPATSDAGKTIQVTDTTKNQGTGASCLTVTSFYLSTNASLDASDTLLGTRDVPELQPGTSHSLMTALTLPTPLNTGTYSLIAKADGPGTCWETQESNNTRNATIKLGPDLTVTALAAPASAAAGAAISITDTTANPAGGAAPASSTRFYLSVNSSYDAADTPLQGRAVPALAAGATNAVLTTVTIPTGAATGTFYLVARADDGNEVTETSEINNTRAAQIRIGPDLFVSALSAPPVTATESTLNVTDTTKNAGGGPAPASTTAFFLSLNQSIDATDIRLVPERSIGPLDGGALSTATTPVTLSNVTPGTWYLIANADDGRVVGETLETNNTRYVTIYVGPDLVVTTISAPATAIAGSTITVSDTAKNQGAGQAVASTTRYYLSLNTTLDASDILLDGERTVPELAGGISHLGSSTVTIPTGLSGRYYVIAKTDAANVVAESRETNNTSARSVTISQ